ncbi:telomerase reverse transcriptase, partial [Clarias magur]
VLLVEEGVHGELRGHLPGAVRDNSQARDQQTAKCGENVRAPPLYRLRPVECPGVHENERGDDDVLQPYFRQDPLPGAVRLHGAPEAQRETQGR